MLRWEPKTKSSMTKFTRQQGKKPCAMLIRKLYDDDTERRTGAHAWTNEISKDTINKKIRVFLEMFPTISINLILPYTVFWANLSEIISWLIFTSIFAFCQSILACVKVLWRQDITGHRPDQVGSPLALLTWSEALNFCVSVPSIHEINKNHPCL